MHQSGVAAPVTRAAAPVAAPAWYRGLVGSLSTYFVLFHIYTGVFGAPTNIVYLPFHLLVALALLFLLHPLGRRWTDPLVPASAIDLLLSAASLALLGYFLTVIDDWQLLYVSLSPLDTAACIVLIAIVVESVRRTVGWSLVLIAVFFCIHALLADKFPGVFFGPPVSFESLLQTLVIGDAGVFGVPVLVMAQYVVLFLLFGRLLHATGAGTFFTRISFAVFGHRVGGPAKAAVVSSGLFGTISGSGVSNVLTTGTFTIPMMIRLGYRRPFAGGVEAAAAVGGSIMPPVMGAVAFMMAEFMGVPYLEIAISAAIPALLYYLAIYWTVHFEARKLGLGRLSRDDLPGVAHILRKHGYLGVPLLMIIVLLLIGYSIVFVALITSLAAILVSYVSAETRITPRRMNEAVMGTARTACTLSATCACAGIIIGAIFATGLSFQISQTLLDFAANQLWLLLVIAALVALVLGTGLTASAVYITMVATLIPILKTAGVPDMAAHMFAFYYGVVSDITPPTALAAVAAAGLARANPLSTMLQASRLGIAAFFVPILFVFAPALLMIGSPMEVALSAVTAAAGLYAFCAGITGFLASPLSLLRRVLLIGAAVALIIPVADADLVGVVLFAAGILPDLLRRSGGNATESAPSPARDEAGATRKESWFDRWLRRRVAQEEDEVADEAPEMSKQACDDLASLKAWLKQDSLGDGQPPEDSRRWAAWLVIGIAVLAFAYVGSKSLHANAPLTWLGALALIALWTSFGLHAAEHARRSG